jgi:hypothetical protein
MSAGEWGTLKEPTLPLAPTEADTARPDERAARASPGAWDEDLGRYGADKWNLPGFGEEGPKCSEWYAEAVCGDCGHLQLGTHNCGRRSCPNCWGIWAKEAGVRATVRVQSFREIQPKDHRRQVAHGVVAPPEGEVMNEREFYEGRARAAEIAEEKGFRGFAVVAHPWRVRESAKQEYREVDPDTGLWVWLRENHDELELREKIYWSPHYHIIGVTTADMEPGDESDEWVYEFIRSMEPYENSRDRESHEDVYGAFRYLLSHTGFPEESTKQSVTWYGDLANAVFVEDASQEYQIQKPSEGVRSAIRREVEAVAGPTDDDESDDEVGESKETDEVGDCPRDGCNGVLIDVFDVEMYLRHNEPPPDVADKMQTAYRWRVGDRSPPPGLKHPQTEEQAREAFEAML